MGSSVGVFERFTERGRQVPVFAHQEARALGHNYVGTEHLLLGLLREGEGVAAQVLGSFDITLERVRAQVARIVGRGEEATSGQVPFTPRVKTVLELALREALSLGHNFIGTEHILLGLVRENEGVAARILVDFHADAEQVRDEVLRAVLPPGKRRPPKPRSRRREAVAAGSGPGVHTRSDPDLARRHALDTIAIRLPETGKVAERLPRGVMLLDRWIGDKYAGVLFWVDGGKFDVWRLGDDVLHCVTLERSAEGTWTTRGGWKAIESKRPERVRAGLAPGLHRLGGVGGPVRLSFVIATPEVAAIRLVSGRGETERPVGVEGMCLLGTTPHDRITYASAINERGEEISANRVVLKATWPDW